MKKIFPILLFLTSGVFAQTPSYGLRPSGTGNHYGLHPIVSSTWRISINTTSASPSITLRGTAPIVINWGDGTVRQTQALTTTADSIVSHTYIPAGAYTITIYNSGNLTKFTTTSNCAWAFNLSSVPRTITYFLCTGSNTITGNLSSLPSVMTYFYCQGSNTITGNLSSLPSGLTYFYCAGSNTITGNLSSLPSGMTYFICYGSNTITGSLSSLPSGMTYFICYGSNTINAYTSPHTWSRNMNSFNLITSSGGLTSAMVDNLCIDLDAAAWAGTGRVLNLTGAGIGAPTSASSAARTDLSNNKAVSVVTN